MKSLFAVQAEIEPLPGSAIHPAAGAFVIVYVPESGLEEALASARRQLEEDDCAVVAFEWATVIDEEEWDNDDPNAPTTEELKKALNSGEILYGSFFSFETEHEH